MIRELCLLCVLWGVPSERIQSEPDTTAIASRLSEVEEKYSCFLKRASSLQVEIGKSSPLPQEYQSMQVMVAGVDYLLNALNKLQSWIRLAEGFDFVARNTLLSNVSALESNLTQKKEEWTALIVQWRKVVYTSLTPFIESDRNLTQWIGQFKEVQESIETLRSMMEAFALESQSNVTQFKARVEETAVRIQSMAKSLQDLQSVSKQNPPPLFQQMLLRQQEQKSWGALQAFKLELKQLLSKIQLRLSVQIKG